MPKLCILTQYYAPELGAPQTRLSELAERLVDQGWSVEVLTALPNYPTGKIFDGYDPRQPMTETIGRVRVVRVPLYVVKGGFSKRIRSYFSFIRGARKHGPKLCSQPDLLFVESPPLFIAYAAWSLSRRWHCPYVANISDLWPESAVRMGVVKPGPLTWLAERLERRFYERSVGVTGTSDGILEGVRRKAPDKRTLLVTNGVEPDRFGRDKATAEARRLIGDEPGPVFLFAGLLGLVHGLDMILDLAASLPAEAPGRFVIVGDGPMREHLEQRLQTERITRVKLLPAQPRESIPALLACADVVISTQGVVVPGAIPNKIYEAMAAGLPILMVSDGEASDRVLQAEAGLISTPDDRDSLRANYLRLASDPALRSQLGAAGRRTAETRYSRSRIADNLHRFLLESLPAQ